MCDVTRKKLQRPGHGTATEVRDATKQRAGTVNSNDRLAPLTGDAPGTTAKTTNESQNAMSAATGNTHQMHLAGSSTDILRTKK